MYLIVAGAGMAARIRRDLQISREEWRMVNSPQPWRSNLDRMFLDNNDFIIVTDDPRLDTPTAVIERILQYINARGTNPWWVWVHDGEYFAPGTNAHNVPVGEMQGPIVRHEDGAAFIMGALDRLRADGHPEEADEDEDILTGEARILAGHRFELEVEVEIDDETGEEEETGQYRWGCTCGAHSSRWREDESEAEAGHVRHLERLLRRVS